MEELENTWSLDDVLRAEALLDMRSDLAMAEKKQRSKNDSR